MPTNFPSALDDFPDPLGTTPLNGGTAPMLGHAQQHRNANDAIEALQRVVGVAGSTDPNSLQFKLAQAGSSNVTVSDTAPTNPKNGDLWYNSTVGRLVIWYNDGSSSQWVSVTSGSIGGGAAVSASADAPTNPSNGELWYDTDICRLLVWYDDGDSGQWVAVSNVAGGSGSGSSTTAGPIAPSTPINGDLWYNTNICRLLVWYDDGDSGQWVAVGAGGGSGGGSSSATTVSATPPASPAVGDLWYDTDVGRLFIWYHDGDSGQWVATASGIVGYTGSAGSGGAGTGYTGSQGPIGYTGSAGATGTAGSQGPIGYTGSIGATGATGPQGPAGAVSTTVGGIGTFLEITYTSQPLYYQGMNTLTLTPFSTPLGESWSMTNPGGTWHWRGPLGTGASVNYTLYSSGSGEVARLTGLIQRVA